MGWLLVFGVLAQFISSFFQVIEIQAFHKSLEPTFEAHPISGIERHNVRECIKDRILSRIVDCGLQRFQLL